MKKIKNRFENVGHGDDTNTVTLAFASEENIQGVLEFITLPSRKG